MRGAGGVRVEGVRVEGVRGARGTRGRVLRVTCGERAGRAGGG